MGKYSSLPAKSELAQQARLDNYPILQTNFEDFMGELIQYVSDEFGIALTQPKKL